MVLLDEVPRPGLEGLLRRGAKKNDSIERVDCVVKHHEESGIVRLSARCAPDGDDTLWTHHPVVEVLLRPFRYSEVLFGNKSLRGVEQRNPRIIELDALLLLKETPLLPDDHTSERLGDRHEAASAVRDRRPILSVVAPISAVGHQYLESGSYWLGGLCSRKSCFRARFLICLKFLCFLKNFSVPGRPRLNLSLTSQAFQ